MSSINRKSKLLSILLPASIGGVLILVGILAIFIGEDILDVLLSIVLMISGVFILFHTFREFNTKRKGVEIIKNDERSRINRLKASDLSFRFAYVLIMLVNLFNAFNLIDDTNYVALTRPILAIGIGLYIVSYNLFERRG